MGQETSHDRSEAARRRSQRVLLTLPILVQGQAADGSPRTEDTRTLVVNAHGALIALAMRVDYGQKLLLRNLKSKEEQRCTVVYLGPAEGAQMHVGIEFIQPTPRFWQVGFPPDDWSPESRPRQEA